MARYDGHADWYDDWSRNRAGAVMAAARRTVLELAPPGEGGLAVDLGCGTGLPAEAVAAHGYRVVGVDVSADQVRVARPRLSGAVVADARRVPVRSGVARLAYSVLTHTDLDGFDRLVGEAVRVLAPGGSFVHVGVHPCFNNPVAEPVGDGVLVHAGYRVAGWRDPSSHRPGGVTQRVGVHHLPLGELLTAFLHRDAPLDRVVERGDGVVPELIGLRLTKPAD